MKYSLPLIGWREYVCLPQLGIEKIKAKVDTGARTSALHAYQIHTYQEGDQHMVEFKVHPLQRQTHLTVVCTAPLLGYRKVTNSGGMPPFVLSSSLL